MSKALEDLKKENKKLHDLVREREKQRKERLKGQNVPDVSNDLKPYSLLPASEKTLRGEESSYGQGWSYKTRRVSYGPVDMNVSYTLDQPDFNETKVFTLTKKEKEMQRKKSSAGKSSSRRSSNRKKEGDEQGGKDSKDDDREGDREDKEQSQSAENAQQDASSDEEPPADIRLALWVRENKQRLLDALTLSDKKLLGELSAVSVRDVLTDEGCPLADDLDTLIEGDEDVVVDYTKWTNRQVTRATQHMNKAKTSSTIPVSLPTIPQNVPSVLPITQLKKIRKSVQKEQEKHRKQREEEEYQRTVEQLEHIGFAKVKSRKSREQLEEAYVTYSSNKAKAKKALRKVGPQKKDKTKKQENGQSK